MSTVVNSKAPKGDPVDESVGTVASDSLAAESISSGGAFSQNPNAAISSVKGAQSTLNNDNTTDAHVLHAADTREDRDIGANVASTKYPSQAGQPAPSTSSGPQSTGTGSHTYPHDASSTAAATGTAGVGIRPYVDSAPTAAYSGDQTSASKPKGSNLHENQDIAPNKTTLIGDVGGPNDPGRLAEQKILNTNAAAGGDAGIPKNASGDDGKNIYDELRSSERA